MERPISPIDLVSFGAVASVDAVAASLRELGFSVHLKPAGEWLEVQALQSHPTVVLLDRAAGESGETIAALERTGHGALLGVFVDPAAEAIASLCGCCREFVFWPCHYRELELRLDRLLPERRAPVPLPTAAEPDEGLAQLGIVGVSPAFLRVCRMLRKIAQCDAPVLLQGETGTGKEMAARAIHYLGSRRDFPFIPLNCGALPDELVENELFGHRRGAYTDAKDHHPGLVEQAERGTLFLDEIGTLSMKAQVALLRFLQNQEYRLVGGREVRHANVRIIAATNADLVELTEQGRFRQDLLFRLNIMSLLLPPVRERREDIPPLIEHMLEKLRLQYEQPGKHFHPSARAWLLDYDWPGNIRQMENLIHREFLLAETDAITLEHCRLAADAGDPVAGLEQLPAGGSFSEAKAFAIESFERDYLVRLMEEVKGNVSLAARRSGKERRAIGKLLKKHGIKPSAYLA